MFSHPEFDSTPAAPKAVSPLQNRSVGLVAFIVIMVVILLFSLGADASLFIPFNASVAASTAASPRTLPPGHPPIAPAQPTRVPNRPPDREL